MASRLRFGSVRALLTFTGFLFVVGISVELRSGIINYAVWAFLLISSVGILIRMWRRRGSPDEFWKSAHGGQIAFLPPKWRRWILGEDDRR
jgi:protein-S-isoprenylcysteine O-methyltransferase Ste14